MQIYGLSTVGMSNVFMIMELHTYIAKGVAECGKETNTCFFFFRVQLDTPPPPTFLIESQLLSQLCTGGWPPFA
ncbi:uncharacterized protein LACBIDRAFT_296565 [Laccaria bicolor S238N-H82]|uniref:Predicted protein n=1 Tax=Laccaria bicolor (strain S238N-H82 / ATCC MYA-4686) TaxID=486041 RepID=B0D945_LACBS|nr:uncharacterized protein LACBIDRAFT_296565 [Laccaria bicolor S238N-H82]EDR08946.1 predicted protein [Laccaria bicolor S238N-H82]|eukprot:XP_001880259.1 predicted protein [Laccaria bicolor S238N-H82]